MVQEKRPLDDEDTEMDGENKRVKTGNETVEVGLLVPSNDMGQVIGKGGETIKNIRAESGATINTSKFIQNMGERTARVAGSIQQVLSALKMIIDTLGKDNPSITFLAEQRNLGPLIGKQGANIKKIREETGTKIFMPKECIGNSTQKEIQISGGYEAVMQAVERVVCCLADGRNPTRVSYVPGDVGGYAIGRVSPTIPTGGAGLPSASVCRIEMTMWVPKETIGQIIGRGGANIQTVRMQSTAHVHVDAGEDGDETPERKITIKGSREAIDMACGMIETLASTRI